jgi:UDP-glucuronate 4-epimerase
LRILVTGSAGFIGMHLAGQLLEEGHEVVGIDNFNDYYSVQLKEARHNRLTQYSNYKGFRCDISDSEQLNRIFSENAFDVVCHLAAQAGVRYSLANPAVYITSNLEGFANILECCRNFKIQKLLYASSSSVYGGNEKLPFSEDDMVDNPVSLYAATKKSNELMAHAYTHLFGFQTVGLRFFTVYGPWGRPDMATWLFTEAMLAGKPIKVFNNGNMMRDFTYIDDIIKGVISCIKADNLDLYEIINIGNNNPEKLTLLISLISESLGIEPRLNMLPMQPGDVPSTYADIARIKDKVGFEPSTPLDEGIPHFVAWYKQYHGIN